MSFRCTQGLSERFLSKLVVGEEAKFCTHPGRGMSELNLFLLPLTVSNKSGTHKLDGQGSHIVTGPGKPLSSL